VNELDWLRHHGEPLGQGSPGHVTYLCILHMAYLGRQAPVLGHRLALFFLAGMTASREEEEMKRKEKKRKGRDHREMVQSR